MTYNWPRNTAPLSGGAVISLHLLHAARWSLFLLLRLWLPSKSHLCLLRFSSNLLCNIPQKLRINQFLFFSPSWKTLFLFFLIGEGEKKWFQTPDSHLICKRKLLNNNQTLGIILITIEVHCMEQNVFIGFNKRVDYCFPHLYFNVPK